MAGAAASVKPSKGLLYLIGEMLADGGIYHYVQYRNGRLDHRYHTHFANEENHLHAEYIKRLAEQELKIPVGLCPRPSKNCYTVLSGRKSVYSYFYGLGVPVGNKSRTVSIPTWIKRLPLADRLTVVRGLFDGEAHVRPRGFVKKRNKYYYINPQIRFGAASAQLVNDISGILSEAGVRHCKYQEMRRGVPYYSLDICRILSVLKFKELVGFDHLRKAQKLDFLVAMYVAQVGTARKSGSAGAVRLSGILESKATA